MSGFFNFLKNLFSGLLGLIGLGSKKTAALGESQPKPAKRSSGYFLELDDAKGVSSLPAKPVEKAADSGVAVAPVAAKKVEAPTKAEPAKPAPAAVAQALNLPQPQITNFATTYLTPGNGSGGRRRPGANMNAYLDMARQAKTSG